MLGARALGELDEGRDHRVGLAVHQRPDELAEGAVLELLAREARPVDVRVAHLVSLEEVLFEEALQGRLNGVHGDAAPRPEGAVDRLGFTISAPPEVLHHGGLEGAKERRSNGARCHGGTVPS